MQEVVGDVYINASSETFHHCFQTRQEVVGGFIFHLVAPIFPALVL